MLTRIVQQSPDLVTFKCWLCVVRSTTAHSTESFRRTSKEPRSATEAPFRKKHVMHPSPGVGVAPQLIVVGGRHPIGLQGQAEKRAILPL